MAFPVVAATNNSSEVSNTTSHTVALPASIDAGDRLILLIGFNDTTTVNTPSGWSLLSSTTCINFPGNPVGRVAIFYKEASGSEGSSVTVTSGTARWSEHWTARITGHNASELPAFSAAVLSGGLSSNTSPNPPSLNPANWDVEDTLWLAMSYSVEDGLTDPTGFPSTYPDNRYANANGVGSAIAVATRNLAAASDDPGTFALPSAGRWRTYTIAIRPAAAIVTGAVALTETVAVTAAGQVTIPGIVSLTETAAITAAGDVFIPGVVSLTQTAAITVEGIRDALGVINLTETVVQGIDGYQDAFGVATLLETVNITAQSTSDLYGVVSLLETVGILIGGPVILTLPFNRPRPTGKEIKGRPHAARFDHPHP